MEKLKPKFNLSRKKILSLEKEYDYEPDPKVQRKEFLTYEDFWKIAEWKTSRQINNYSKNDDTLVREVTKASFSASSERLKIVALTALEGVGYPVASAILHFGHSESYPIIDFRAIYSLWRVPLGRKASTKENTPIYYNFDLWKHYVDTCRDIAKQLDVSVRQLDKALWQYYDEL